MRHREQKSDKIFENRIALTQPPPSVSITQFLSDSQQKLVNYFHWYIGRYFCIVASSSDCTSFVVVWLVSEKITIISKYHHLCSSDLLNLVTNWQSGKNWNFLNRNIIMQRLVTNILFNLFARLAKVNLSIRQFIR